MGTLCDALLDGAIVLVESALEESAKASSAKAAEQRRKMMMAQSGMARRSSSAPSLSRMSVQGDLGAGFSQTVLNQNSTCVSDSSEVVGLGFTMKGLPRDSWEAWNTGNFHACPQGEPYVERIAATAAAQRPRRRIVRRRENLADQRKYCWPMMKTNFPDVWDATSDPYAPRTTKHGGASAEVEREPPIGVDRLGRTTFPYSLVSHRAFIESQPDPVLKEKAKKIAPLRTTTIW